MIEVLSVASEVYPLVKTGGLADVAGALPAALAAHGVDDAHAAAGLSGGDGRARATASVRRTSSAISSAARRGCSPGRAGGLDLIVLDAPHLYDRPGNPYLGPDGSDWPDNWRRFAALCRVAADDRRAALRRRLSAPTSSTPTTGRRRWRRPICAIDGGRAARHRA